METKNAVISDQNILEESLDFDELESKLQEELDRNIAELEILEEQREEIGNPEALGNAIMNTVWEQFVNQIAVTAGEDFIRENNGLTLDLSKDAHIQTTENFAKGNIATHNTEINYQERYDNWQDSFKRDENGNIVMRKDHRTGKEKAVVKEEARAPFDKGRPKGSKTTHMDHDIPAAEIIRDPEANAHLTREEQVEFANSKVNLHELDASANESKGDSTMVEWLNSERNGQKPADRFGLDEEKLMEQDRIAREECERLKKEGEKKSIKAGKKSRRAEAFRITGKAARAVFMQLLAELLRKIIRKFVLWLKSTERTLASLLTFIKDAVVSFVSDVQKNLIIAGNAALTVIATSILGPVVRTIKNAWILLKQGWVSLKEAVAYVKNPKNRNKPTGILVAEVGKIIMAGLSVSGAVILGDVIEKGLMAVPLFAVEIPLLGSMANLIGIFMGAVIAGILGALALHFIDRLIANRQKAAMTERLIDTGNDILNTQREIIAVNELKTEKNKRNVTQNIKDRHQMAANIMKATTDSIMSKKTENHDDEFQEMNSRLGRLLN